MPGLLLLFLDVPDPPADLRRKPDIRKVLAMSDQRKLAFPPMPLPAAVECLKEEITTRNQFVEAHKTALADKDEKLVEHLGMIRARLEAGETTGDRITDLMLRVHGFDQGMIEKYAALEAQLEGRRGEFVLISFDTSVPFKHTMTHTEDRHASCYRIGVLEDEHLKIGESFGMKIITFPVSRYIYGEKSILMNEKNLPHTLPIEIGDLFEHYFHGMNPPLLSELLQEVDEELRGIFIGDDAVKGWLKRHLMPGLFKPAADALSKLILEPTTED